MKYLKIIFITILLLTIMIIPVNATIFTLPDLPGEYEDYIIFNSSSLGGNYSGIVAFTFNNLKYMHVGTYEEYLEIYDVAINPPIQNSNDIFYFITSGYPGLKVKYYKLFGDEWELISSSDGNNYCYYFGGNATNSINNSDILYSSRDIIDLEDGSIFFFKGTWMKATMTRPLLGMTQYLIGLLIVLVGFSKGLQFLFKTLRKA